MSATAALNQYRVADIGPWWLMFPILDRTDMGEGEARFGAAFIAARGMGQCAYLIISAFSVRGFFSKR